jgi:aminopeptidase N
MNNNRLSKNIYPTNYNLHITTDICSLTFSGKIIINIIALEQYNNFILHCKNLLLIQISLNNNIIPQSNIKLDNKLETLYINNTINKGNNILEIHYNGLLNEHLEGYYKSKYTYNDIEHFIATTQFEPGYARQAFPCFDEPNFKATFDITLTSHIDKTILSNTSVVKETINHSNKTKTLVFETTPKMSSYLVAFIVGDFDYIEGTCNNILIRTYATPNNKSKLQLSLDICIKCLDYFIKWFKCFLKRRSRK